MTRSSRSKFRKLVFNIKNKFWFYSLLIPVCHEENWDASWEVVSVVLRTNKELRERLQKKLREVEKIKFFFFFHFK